MGDCFSRSVITLVKIDDVREDLSKSDPVSIMTDAANRKLLQIIPFVVRSFVAERGMKVKLLKFSVPDET